MSGALLRWCDSPLQSALFETSKGTPPTTLSLSRIRLDLRLPDLLKSLELIPPAEFLA